jgi:hypothetical protein
MRLGFGRQQLPPPIPDTNCIKDGSYQYIHTVRGIRIGRYNNTGLLGADDGIHVWGVDSRPGRQKPQLTNNSNCQMPGRIAETT